MLDTFKVPCSIEEPGRRCAPLLSAVQKGPAGWEIERDECFARPGYVWNGWVLAGCTSNAVMSYGERSDL